MNTTVRLEEFVKDKVFRLRENMKKVEFILKNSDISPATLVKASTIARSNDYHNFGHQLGVTEYSIKIAMAEKRSRSEINALAFSGLIHDAGHMGYNRGMDEMISLELTEKIMDDTDFKIIDINPNVSFARVRDLVMATIFTTHGKIDNPNAKILQDADLAHLGQGIYYWLWASMGLIKEFSKEQKREITPTEFIYVIQEKFVDLLANLSPTGSVFLSPGANRIFRNPIQDVQELKSLPEEAVMYAYNVRHDDITVMEFEVEVKKICAKT